MTIKKKIWISNILMVLIPVFITGAVIAVSIHTSLGAYWHSLESMYQDENRMQSAMSLIYTYQQELWDTNWAEHCTPSAEGVVQNDRMYRLERQLSDMGYHIMVEKNGNQLYSNIPEEDILLAREAAGDAIFTARTMALSNEKITVVKNTFTHEQKVLSILALNSEVRSMEGPSYLQNYILRYILLFAAVFFVGMILVNVLLSWWISRSVLVPLGILRKGIQEIRDGNLDTRLFYKKTDEFGEMCRDFEDMGSYLKESVNQRLEDENRKRELIRGISHDLRTPLTSIEGYVDGLLDGIADTPKMREEYLSAIKIRAADLERLVDSLSQYNRLDSRIMEYHLQDWNLKDFLKQYIKNCREELEQNQVSVAISGGWPACEVKLDENEMKRVLDNLFTNTVRYRERDKSAVAISLTHSEDGKWVRMTFEDDGPGVPEECLDKIFDTFYRVDGARSRTGEGSGIGLAVVKEIITGHSGRIYAKNHGGLSIVIELPTGKEDSL